MKNSAENPDSALRQILRNNYSQEHSKFDEQEFQQNWHLDFFILFGMLNRFVKMQHRINGGDLTMHMVVAEIWIYNIGKRLAASTSPPESEELATNEGRRRTLPKCNAYSISLALEMSPETVRRKVKKLMDMGWVERSPGGELMVTAECEKAYNPQVNLEIVRDFVATARVLMKRMNLKLEP